MGTGLRKHETSGSEGIYARELQGWQSKTSIDAVRCGKILRYTLNLAYD